MDVYKVVILKDGQPYLAAQFECGDKENAIAHIKELATHYTASAGYSFDVTMTYSVTYKVDMT